MTKQRGDDVPTRPDVSNFRSRVAACLSEAGFPPDRTDTDEFSTFAHWDRKPPVAVLLKAIKVAGADITFDADAYEDGTVPGLRINLEDLSVARHAEACAARGARIISKWKVGS